MNKNGLSCEIGLRVVERAAGCISKVEEWDSKWNKVEAELEPCFSSVSEIRGCKDTMLHFRLPPILMFKCKIPLGCGMRLHASVYQGYTEGDDIPYSSLSDLGIALNMRSR